MRQVAPRPLTVADYLEFPEGPPHLQLVNGDIFMSPQPSLFHQHILMNIVGIIAPFLAKKKIGYLFTSPVGVFLTEVNVYEPDLAFVSKKRKSLLSDRGIEGAPDWVAEILSPSTGRLDKGPKRTVYARTGVKELWLVDPVALEVRVFDLRNDPDTPKAVYGEEDEFASPIFPGLKFSGAAIFQRY